MLSVLFISAYLATISHFALFFAGLDICFVNSVQFLQGPFDLSVFQNMHFDENTSMMHSSVSTLILFVNTCLHFCLSI